MAGENHPTAPWSLWLKAAPTRQAANRPGKDARRPTRIYGRGSEGEPLSRRPDIGKTHPASQRPQFFGQGSATNRPATLRGQLTGERKSKIGPRHWGRPPRRSRKVTHPFCKK